MAQWGQIGFSNPIIVGATVLGDIVSLNWDGDIPPNLPPALTATRGYYLRSSDGNLFLMGSVFTAGIALLDALNSNKQVGAIGALNDELLINDVGAASGIRVLAVNDVSVQIISGKFRATMTAINYPRTTPQNLANATLTPVQWHAPLWQYGTGSFSLSVANITVPETGLLDVFVYIEWSPSGGTGERLVNLLKNGTLEMGDRRQGIGNTQRTSLSTTIDVTAGDIIRVDCHQNSGGLMTITDAHIKLAYRETQT